MAILSKLSSISFFSNGHIAHLSCGAVPPRPHSPLQCKTKWLNPVKTDFFFEEKVGTMKEDDQNVPFTANLCDIKMVPHIYVKKIVIRRPLLPVQDQQ